VDDAFVQDQSSGKSLTVVASDPSRSWSFGWRFCMVGVPSVWVLVACGLVADALQPRHYLAVSVISTAVLALYGFGFCAAWLAMGRHRVAYVRSDRDLLVLRRGRVVDRVPLADIEDIAIAGWMDTRHIITDPTPPPDWPYAIVSLRSGRAVNLTEVMIWGRDAALDAETRLKDILKS
jgi:hypothetical protein